MEHISEPFELDHMVESPATSAMFSDFNRWFGYDLETIWFGELIGHLSEYFHLFIFLRDCWMCIYDANPFALEGALICRVINPLRSLDSVGRLTWSVCTDNKADSLWASQRVNPPKIKNYSLCLQIPIFNYLNLIDIAMVYQ